MSRALPSDFSIVYFDMVATNSGMQNDVCEYQKSETQAD